MPDGTTARTLAPSKEAFDTPLSPPPLGDEPGPATGRSGIYPDGTCTRRSGPVFRTQHPLVIWPDCPPSVGLVAPRSGTIAQSVGLQRSARLLVIDEDEKRALEMTAELEQQGFAVRYAGNGPAGFALMAQQMPDLLLVSAILPGMPGIDVCRHVRRAGSEVPIIVLSPRSDEIDVVVAMEMGATAHCRTLWHARTCGPCQGRASPEQQAGDQTFRTTSVREVLVRRTPSGALHGDKR